MKNFKQVLETIEKNKIENNMDEKEIEKAYDLFCDNMTKCCGYCDMSYNKFKKNCYRVIERR